MGMLAKYWQPKDNKKVQCMLCPHNCVIKEDKAGLCIIRKNVDGVLQQTAYGQICSSAMDPIEKKPLYHFYPGSKILSVGTNGCNMQCSYCQNWQISTRETNRMDTSPERLVTIAQENNSIGIAYTYNEPLVWYEFVLDCAKEFRKAGLKNVLVSNGQINPEPLAELAPYIDAANIDLKAFNPEFYKSESGDFETTKNTIKALHKSGTHLELTNLVIPEKNDSYEEFENMCKFISEISRDIPLHISRYFPQHHLDIPPTTIKLLKDFYNIAEKYLNYVFIGNAREDGKSDTYCPNCKKKIIEREGYQISCETDKPICPDCSQQLSVYF